MFYFYLVKKFVDIFRKAHSSEKTHFTTVFPSCTYFAAELTETMRIKCLDHGHNILMQHGFEPSMAVNRNRNLTHMNNMLHLQCILEINWIDLLIWCANTVISNNAYTCKPTIRHWNGPYQHSLTHSCQCPILDAELQTRSATPVCCRPSIEWNSMSDGRSSSPLLSSDVRCYLAVIVCVSSLASRGEPYGWCSSVPVTWRV